MSNDRNGPQLQLSKSCFGCRHEVSESYAVQSDSGHTVYCAHPEHGQEGKERRRVGDTTWNTPDWCPMLPNAVAAFAKSLS